MRVVVVCFATPGFEGSARVLEASALRAGRADAVRIFRPDDVADHLRASGHDPIANPRGHALWAWQPHVARKALLEDCRPGDALVYLDAATRVIADLRPLCAHVAVSGDGGVGLFRLGQWASHAGYLTGAWSTGALLDEVVRIIPPLRGGNEDPAHRRRALELAPQVCGNVQVYVRSPAAEGFLRDYEAACTPAALADRPDCPDHRHNQSVLSCLALLRNVPLRRDPSQFGASDPPLFGHPDQDGIVLLDAHRARLPRVAVLTPATGHPLLRACMESVRDQDFPATHVVVLDGPHPSAERVLSDFPGAAIVRLPWPTGRDRWNGHRIYAALPFLLPWADRICLLDEDNAIRSDHVSSLLEACADGDYAHSLRDVTDGARVIPDAVESLGLDAPAGVERFMDVSTLMLSRGAAMAIAPLWNRPARPPDGAPEVDRAISLALTTHFRGASTGRRTLLYRTGNRPDSVQLGFFERLPRGPMVFLFHLCPDAARDAFAAEDADGWVPWQLELVQALRDRLPGHPVVDAYESVHDLRPGDTLLCHVWNPDALPLALLRSRPPGVRRVAAMIEGPNIRHAGQYGPAFLLDHFDTVFTYVEALLALGPPFERMVFPYRFGDPTRIVRAPDPLAGQRSIVMCLQRRPELEGRYRVPGLDGTFTCLDPARETLACGLRDVAVIGDSWVGHHPNASPDPHRLPVKHWFAHRRAFTFALVVENTDARGYLSEKLLDACVCGLLPLFLGNPGPELADLVRKVALDLREFGTTEELQAHLDALSDADLVAWGRRVHENTPALLIAMGPKSFADRIATAVET